MIRGSSARRGRAEGGVGLCGGQKAPATRTRRPQRRRNTHANAAPDHPEAKDSQALTCRAATTVSDNDKQASSENQITWPGPVQRPVRRSFCVHHKVRDLLAHPFVLAIV